METTFIQKFKKLLPFIAMIVIFVLIKNWWRVELLYNPVAVEVINANQVTLYSTRWCPYCRKDRDTLSIGGSALRV